MPSVRKLLLSVEIEQVSKSDYAPFARFHYRKGALAAVDKVYALRLPQYGRVGIIVYSYSPPHLAARRLALAHIMPKNPSRSEMMAFINANIRIISRVVVLPQWRGASIASFLVENTMDRVGVAVIEAVAAMGRFNRFFEKAAMKKIIPPPNPKKKLMKTTLKAAGFNEKMMLDADLAIHRISELPGIAQQQIWKQAAVFIGAYGNKRLIKDKRQLIATILSKINGNPAYFYKITKPLSKTIINPPKKYPCSRCN
jgi:GNAT superfamily N-acetyltransferase